MNVLTQVFIRPKIALTKILYLKAHFHDSKPKCPYDLEIFDGCAAVNLLKRESRLPGRRNNFVTDTAIDIRTADQQGFRI
jgi:hypothetical protein